VPAFNISMFHSDWNCLISVDGGVKVVGAQRLIGQSGR
jgi:hypothetical protein